MDSSKARGSSTTEPGRRTKRTSSITAADFNRKIDAPVQPDIPKSFAEERNQTIESDATVASSNLVSSRNPGLPRKVVLEDIKRRSVGQNAKEAISKPANFKEATGSQFGDKEKTAQSNVASVKNDGENVKTDEETRGAGKESQLETQSEILRLQKERDAAVSDCRELISKLKEAENVSKTELEKAASRAAVSSLEKEALEKRIQDLEHALISSRTNEMEDREMNESKSSRSRQRFGKSVSSIKQDQHTQTEASGDEYESLENLLLELQTENASLVKSQQSIMEKLQDSVKKVAHYKTLHENAERLADENLNECIVELQGNEQWLLDEITAKDMEIACLSKQLDQSMIRLARTERSQIRKLRDTEIIFKREETRMIEKIEALEADVSVLTEAKTAAEKQTTAKINALESQIKGLKSAIQPSSVPSELQLKVTTLQNELTSKDRQIAEMRAASDSMMDLQKQNSESLKAEVETLKNRLLLVEAGHLQYREDADITISGLKKQITELLEMDRPDASLDRIEDESSDKLDTSESNRRREVNFFKSRMESLLIVEAEKEKSIHALKLNIQEIEETNSASISNLNAEIFQLSQKLEQRDGEQKVLVDLVREKNDAKLQLILENEKLMDTIKEHEKLSREAKKTASAKQQQSSVAIQINGTEFDEKRMGLESRISELEATADRDVSEISRLNNVIRIQSHNANSLEASKTDLESQIQAKNLLLSDQEDAIDRLSKELATTSLQAGQAVERVENLELRLEEMARVQAADPSSVNDSLFEVDRLQDEINALRAQLEATTKLLTEERQSLEAEKERRLTLLSEHLIQVARLEMMIEAASTFGALNDSASFNRNSMEDDFTCSSQDNSDPTYAQSEGSRSCGGLNFERAESLEAHFEEVPKRPESNSNVPRSQSETVLDAPKPEALNISLERGESEKQLFSKDEKQTLTQDEESSYIFTVQDIKSRNRADSFKSSQIPLFLLPGAILEERPSQFSLDGVCNSSEEMRPTSSQPNLPHVIKSVKQEMRKNLKNMNNLTKAASPEKNTPSDDSEDAIVDIGSFTGVNEWELPERWDSCFIVAVKTNLKDALVELDRAMRHDKNCDYSLISKIRPSTFGKIQVSENEIALWSQDDSISISIQAGHYLNIYKRVQWIGNFEINKPIRASGLLACYVSTNEAAVVIDPENRVFVARSPGFAAYSLEGSLQLVEFVDLKDFGKDSECYERLLDGSRGALLGWKKNVFSTNGSEIPVATFYAVPKTSLLFLKRGSQLLQLKSGIHVITNPENAFHGFFLTEGTAKFPTKPVYTTDGIEVVMEVNLEYRLDSALLLAANYSSPLEALVTPTQSAVHALVSRLTYQQFQRSQRAEGEAPSKNEGWLDELKSATLEELQKEAQLLGIHVSMEPQDPTTPTDNRGADEAEFRSPQLAPQKQMNLKVSTNAPISSLSGRTPQTTSALTASPQSASPRRRSNSFTASEINSRKHWELPSPQILHPTIIDNPIEYHTNIPELKPPVFIEETEESSHENHQLASAEAPEAAVTLPKFQETIEELLANEKWLIDEITQKNKELELQTRLSNESQLKLARVERALLRSESRLSSPTHKDKALSPTNCERGAFLSPGGASFGRLCSISAENLPRFSNCEASDGGEERNRKQDTHIGQNSTAKETESESHSPSSTAQLQQNNTVPLESYQLLQTKLSECESMLLEFEGNEKWLLEEITGKDEEMGRLNKQVLRLANKVVGLEKQMGNKDRTIAKLQSDAATTQSKLETMLAERETMRLADDRLKKTQEADTKLLKTRIVEMEKEAIQKEEKLNSLQHQLRELEDCLKKANQENETSKLSIHQFENALFEATAHLKTDPKQGLHLKRLDDRLEPVVSSLETNLVARTEVEQVPTAFEISPPTSTDESHHIDGEQTLKTCDGTMTDVTDAHENDAFSGELPSREQTTSSDSYELRELHTTPHAADGNNTTRCSPEARSDCSELTEARICESLQNAENETKDSDEQSGAGFSAQAQAFSDLMAAAVEVVSALREAERLIVSAIGQIAERHDRVADGLEIAFISPPGPLEERVIPTVSEKEKIAFEEMAVYCNQLKAAIDAINSSDSRSRVINEENCQKLVKSEQANSDLQNNLSILQNDLSILQQQYSNERARNANAPSVDEVTVFLCASIGIAVLTAIPVKVVTFQRRLSEVEGRLAESLDGEKLEKRTHGLELILSEQTSALIDRIRELETAICSKLDGLSQLEHEWSRYLASPMEDCRSGSLPATMSCESNSNLSKLHVLEADGETLFVREVRLSEPSIPDNAPPASISSSAAEVFCDAQQSAAASCGDLLEIKPSRLSEPLQTHMYHLEENQYSLDDLLASLDGEHFPTLSPDNQPSPTLSLESGIFESEASTNVTRRESDQLGVIAQHSLDVGETRNAGLKTPVGVRKSVKPSDALAHRRYEPYV
ncbi:hypothetical protein CcCBS67573_g06459 [Chytriomyces confervae]|uniref:Band 7 domain-containing protein n=1 Tax=Chytriomyces confervae TaxID=246404 RepID=A0A507F3B1_9FUNG|nr:hypothetical protein CcCBS67573_g06459 [Chytriomyces confervae]